MHHFLIEMLECPVCHGDLAWQIVEQHDDRIEQAEAGCTACRATYPIREGIGVFLTPDLPRNDLWDQVESGLTRHLRQNPKDEHRLIGAPLDQLNPADQFFRALVLEERGQFNAAQAASNAALARMYTLEYQDCSNAQIEYVIEQLTGSTGPIVDLASGRGYLAEKMARQLDRPIVATDFSPRVLRRNRRWFEHFGLYDRVSLLAFDARRTPFRDNSIKTATSYVGLSNIEATGSLLQELRRVVDGKLLAVSLFYSEDDLANAQAIEQAGLSALLYRRAAVTQFVSAGWQVDVANVCRGPARPTPRSAIFEDAGIDSLPVVDTTLEWCTLVAK